MSLTYPKEARLKSKLNDNQNEILCKITIKVKK